MLLGVYRVPHPIAHVHAPCAQRAPDLHTPAAPGLLHTPARPPGVAAAPTLAHLHLLPEAGAEVTHPLDLALRFAVAVMHLTADPALQQGGPGLGPGPGRFLVPHPSAALVPAPTTLEAQVVAAVRIAARFLGLSRPRAVAKARGGTVATPGLSQDPSHLLLDADAMIHTLALLPPSGGVNHGVEASREPRLLVDKLMSA